MVNLAKAIALYAALLQYCLDYRKKHGGRKYGCKAYDHTAWDR